ncbi:MAG: carboxymuconolactone decarboxylase family protein [bacterium]|nr:carboxymuconolactone decarboxylase family protein [bacterium]
MTTTTQTKTSNALPVNTIETAPEEAKTTLQSVQKMLGFVPNLYGMLSNNPVTLDAYLYLSKALEKSGLNALEQQVVLLTGSIENGCEYCVAAHSAIAGMMKLPESVVQALRNSQPIVDEKLESLRSFTATVVQQRGHLKDVQVSEFLAAGYTGATILAVITAVALKTISNYANHIANTPLDEAFQSHSWSA